MKYLAMLRLICLYCILLFYSCKDAAKSHTHNPTNKIVGGPFEHLGWMFDDIPKELNEVDTSSAWIAGKEKLIVTGKVINIDGSNVAANVIVYYYHTNEQGLYVHDAALPYSMKPRNGQSHGALRGWVKTNEKGEYSIYTIRPAPYPDRTIPAHIHLTVKEPNDLSAYYIDDIVFDDDELLDSTYPARMEKRGGSGVVHLQKKDNIWYAQRDINLGLNIPDYPAERK